MNRLNYLGYLVGLSASSVGLAYWANSSGEPNVFILGLAALLVVVTFAHVTFQRLRAIGLAEWACWVSFVGCFVFTPVMGFLIVFCLLCRSNSDALPDAILKKVQPIT